MTKLRGQKYRGGYHDFVIQTGGLDVFPRLVAGEHTQPQKRGLLKSGNAEIDALLGGGLPYGTSAVLIGPAGSGKSTLAILLKRGLEEYSRTDEGALYAIRGSPLRENPLNLIPASLRAEFRDRYGVTVNGELSPWARDFVEREFEGDFVRVPVERVFLAEASRVGIGTYAPHDPTTADIADLVGSVDLAKVAQIGKRRDARRGTALDVAFGGGESLPQLGERLAAKERGKKQAVGLERAANLQQRSGQVVDALQREPRDDEIEDAVAKRQRLFVGGDRRTSARQRIGRNNRADRVQSA